MRNGLVLFLFSIVVFISCKKDSSCKSLAPATVATVDETAYLQNYLTANNLTASSKNGMFYTITNAGSGESPNLCSMISVTYTGTLINGTTDGAQFDASGNTERSFTLNQLIAGWQLVLPLIKSGGSVTLYIPPSLGYGAQARPGLPANSYLKFTITVTGVR